MSTYYRFTPKGFYGNPYFNNKLRNLAIAVGLYYAVHIDRVEDTGRYRFLVVPQWLERKLAKSVYQSTLMNYKPFILPNMNPKSVVVRQIIDQIVKSNDFSATNTKPTDWQTHVIAGNFPPNAFVLPGGKVFVFESLFRVCQNKDGLATVLSHETAHQILRHSNEQLSRQPLKWVLAIALNIFIGIDFSPNMLNVFTELPASRKMETEADLVGLKLMARACFDPNQAVGLWERMARNEANVPQFLSTHPTSANRIKEIKRVLPEMDLIYGLC